MDKGGHPPLSDQPGLEHVHESTLNDAYPSAAAQSSRASTPAPPGGTSRGVKRPRSLSPAHAIASPTLETVEPDYLAQDEPPLTYPEGIYHHVYDYPASSDAQPGTGIEVGRDGLEVLGMGETELRQEVYRLRKQVRDFQEGEEVQHEANVEDDGIEPDLHAEGEYAPNEVYEGHAQPLSFNRDLSVAPDSDRNRDRDGEDAAQTLRQIATIALEQGGSYGPLNEGIATEDGQEYGVNDLSCVAPTGGSGHDDGDHVQSGPRRDDGSRESSSTAFQVPTGQGEQDGPDRFEVHSSGMQSGGHDDYPTEPLDDGHYYPSGSTSHSAQHDEQHADDLEMNDMGLTLAHAEGQDNLHLPSEDVGMTLDFSLDMSLEQASPSANAPEYPFGMSIDALGAAVAPDDPPRKRRRTVRRSAFDIDENGKGPLPKVRPEVPVSYQTGKRLIVRDRTDQLARAIRSKMREEWGTREEDLLPGPENGGPDWLKGPRHEENIAYTEEIARAVYLDIENGECKVDVPITQHDLNLIKIAAQTAFLNLSKRYSYQVSDDAKKRQSRIAKRGRRWARKDLKQRKRSKAATTVDDVPAFVLKIEYMSSEDSSEGEASGLPEGLWDECAAATGRLNEEEKVLEIKTPKWRSADLQTIYDRVDEAAAQHVFGLKGKGHMAPPMRRFKLPELRERRPPADATEAWLYVDGIVPPAEMRGKPTPAYKLPKTAKVRTAKDSQGSSVAKESKAPGTRRRHRAKVAARAGADDDPMAFTATEQQDPAAGGVHAAMDDLMADEPPPMSPAVPSQGVDLFAAGVPQHPEDESRAHLNMAIIRDLPELEAYGQGSTPEIALLPGPGA